MAAPRSALQDLDLALLQKLLGPHRRRNRVQYDTDGLRELIEKGQVNIAELSE